MVDHPVVPATTDAEEKPWTILRPDYPLVDIWPWLRASLSVWVRHLPGLILFLVIGQLVVLAAESGFRWLAWGSSSAGPDGFLVLAAEAVRGTSADFSWTDLVVALVVIAFFRAAALGIFVLAAHHYLIGAHRHRRGVLGLVPADVELEPAPRIGRSLEAGLHRLPRAVPAYFLVVALSLLVLSPVLVGTFLGSRFDGLGLPAGVLIFVGLLALPAMALWLGVRLLMVVPAVVDGPPGGAVGFSFDLSTGRFGSFAARLLVVVVTLLPLLLSTALVAELIAVVGAGDPVATNGVTPSQPSLVLLVLAILASQMTIGLGYSMISAIYTDLVLIGRRSLLDG
jgi:hypothetical protein